MRILICHNWYQYTGGEDNVVRTEMSLLSNRGHEVMLLDADNRVITSFADKVRTATTAAHSRAARLTLTTQMMQMRPDIVHLHNFFPLLTPAVLDAARDARIPIVHTLHNYRLLCPAATLSRLGRPCELCLDGSAMHAVRHRCYRGSYPGSASVAWMVELHRRLQTFPRKVDRFIALTQFARSVFVRGGLPADRIAVKPDATPDPTEYMNLDFADQQARSGNYALFVGRLSLEKGVSTLLRSWRSVPMPLRIAGTGPFNTLVAQAARDDTRDITYLGYIPAQDVYRQLLHAEFLVMPSQCYEGFGIVLIEAFAHGVPVLASRLGSMAEIVEDGVTGLLFRPGDPRDLAAKATWLAEHPEERRRMGLAARRLFEEKYTLDRNYAQLMSIYEDVLSASEPWAAAAS